MNILITGANRGLGLEFVNKYKQNKENQVFACCRNPKDLKIEAGNVSIHKLNVTSNEDLLALKQEIKDTPIDVLIHNAGVYDKSDHFGNTDTESWLHAIKVNVIAPLKLSEVLIDNITASNKKTIAIITSKMGSLADNTSGGSYIYRSSKTAVNMVGVNMGHDLKAKKVVVLLLHPGWVETDMGGPNALIKPKESIEGMSQVIDNSSIVDSGCFFAYDGKKIDW